MWSHRVLDAVMKEIHRRFSRAESRADQPALVRAGLPYGRSALVVLLLALFGAIAPLHAQIVRGHHASLDEAFKSKFHKELPETLNEDHQILIVGREIDVSTERIVQYLSEAHNVNINVATFNYFSAPGGHESAAGV